MAVCLVLLGASRGWCDGETSVSWLQTNFGDPLPIEDSSGPAPLPLASLVGGTETTSYDLEATFDLSNSTSLKTTAFMAVSAGSDDITNNWETLHASAMATASLAELAFVQGVPGAGSGTVEFHWTVTGDTTLVLQDAVNVDVQLLAAQTTFRSNIPNLGDILIDELHTAPAGAGGNFEVNVPVSAGGLVLPVPWAAGQEIPVFFELFSRVNLQVANTDFGGFRAELAAEFGNSAVLNGVLIRDATGTLLDEASLVTVDGSFRFPNLAMPGDFNGDGELTATDIDLLSRQVLEGDFDAQFNLNGDDEIDQEDRRIWVEDLYVTLFGDADLDREVEFADFLTLASVFGQEGGWEQGDFDGDGLIEFADFLQLSSSFGESAGVVTAVPEPRGAGLLLVGTLASWLRIRSRRPVRPWLHRGC